MKTVGIVLAAGSGKRMGTEVKKQYLLLHERPVLYYSLKAMQDSFIDEIVLVTSKDDLEYVKANIVDEFGFSKVSAVVEGGKERYHSVLCGLRAIDDADFVFIQDGARPLLDNDILKRCLDAVSVHEACVVGMPSKDTVKIANDKGFVATTPNRNLVWNIQTPQVFKFSLIKEAYESIVSRETELKDRGVNITDDAMVLEEYNGHPVFLVEGSYENIKVTTPEDMLLAELFLKKGVDIN